MSNVKDGAYEGFMPSKENMMKSLDMQLPKLKNFLMAGQMAVPGWWTYSISTQR